MPLHYLLQSAALSLQLDAYTARPHDGSHTDPWF